MSERAAIPPRPGPRLRWFLGGLGLGFLPTLLLSLFQGGRTLAWLVPVYASLVLLGAIAAVLLVLTRSRRWVGIGMLSGLLIGVVVLLSQPIPPCMCPEPLRTPPPGVRPTPTVTGPERSRAAFSGAYPLLRGQGSLVWNEEQPTRRGPSRERDAGAARRQAGIHRRSQPVRSAGVLVGAGVAPPPDGRNGAGNKAEWRATAGARYSSLRIAWVFHQITEGYQRKRPRLRHGCRSGKRR